jgi:hypothetical protein
MYLGVASIQLSDRKSKDRPPIDLASAFDGLCGHLLGAGYDRSPERRQQALREYVQATSRLVTAPLLREAELARDPVRQLLWLQLAELNSAFVGKSAVAREQQLKEMTRGISDSDSHSKLVPEMLAISARIIAIAKELSRCKETRPQARAARPAPPKFELSKRFGNSELVTQN